MMSREVKSMQFLTFLKHTNEARQRIWKTTYLKEEGKKMHGVRGGGAKEE